MHIHILVTVHHEIINYPNSENVCSDVAAKMYSLESLKFLNFYIKFYKFFHRGGSSGSWKQDCGRSPNTGPG